MEKGTEKMWANE